MLYLAASRTLIKYPSLLLSCVFLHHITVTFFCLCHTCVVLFSLICSGQTAVPVLHAGTLRLEANVDYVTAGWCCLAPTSLHKVLWGQRGAPWSSVNYRPSLSSNTVIVKAVAWRRRVARIEAAAEAKATFRFVPQKSMPCCCHKHTQNYWRAVISHEK